MRDRFRQFMAGRYGNDQLNNFLFFTTMILVIIDLFVKTSFLSWIGFALIIWAYVRMMSRNVSARYAENERFLDIWSRITGIFRRSGNRGGYSSYGSQSAYRIFRCPQCRQKIRIPKGKGKIQIRCPRCGKTFIKRT